MPFSHRLGTWSRMLFSTSSSCPIAASCSGLLLICSGGVVIWVVKVHSGDLFNSATPNRLLVPFSLLGILLTIYMRENIEGSEREPEPGKHDVSSGPVSVKHREDVHLVPR